MVLDLVVSVLLLIAFIAGFQQGVVRTFSLLIALLLAGAFVLLITPYALDFVHASAGDQANVMGVVALVLLFGGLVLSLSYLMRKLWRHQNSMSKFWNNTFGGVILTLLMIGSISILSGFLDNARMLSPEIKADSIAYRYLQPLQEQTQILWEQMKDSADLVRQEGQKVHEATVR